MSPRRAGVARDDDGSILVLALGLLVVVLVLALVVAAATRLHLDRMRLAQLADELALDAADSLDLARYYSGALAEPTFDRAVELNSSRLESAVAQRLGDARDRAGLPEARVTVAGTEDGYTATVTVQARVYPLFALDVLAPFDGGVVLEATASARSS